MEPFLSIIFRNLRYLPSIMIQATFMINTLETQIAVNVTQTAMAQSLNGAEAALTATNDKFTPATVISTETSSPGGMVLLGAAIGFAAPLALTHQLPREAREVNMAEGGFLTSWFIFLKL